jgi:1,4-dihydroxy-2-naphthoyl-CoA hydrolase
VALEEGLDGVFGMELEEISGERASARIPVTRRLCQRFGLVHGGTYCAIAEFLASEGTVAGVRDEGNLAMGTQNSSYFLRAVSEGVLHAEGRPRHRGRTVWVWDVDFTDDRGRLCATSRVSLAVRPAPDDAPEALRPG